MRNQQNQELVDRIASEIAADGLDLKHLPVSLQDDVAIYLISRGGSVEVIARIYKDGRVWVLGIPAYDPRGWRYGEARAANPAALWQQATETSNAQSDEPRFQIKFYTADSDEIGEPMNDWGEDQFATSEADVERILSDSVDLYRSLLEDDGMGWIDVGRYYRSSVSVPTHIYELNYVGARLSPTGAIHEDWQTEYLIAEVHEIEPAA